MLPYWTASRTKTTWRKLIDDIRDGRRSDLGLTLSEAMRLAEDGRRAWRSAAYNLGCQRVATWLGRRRSISGWTDVADHG